MTNQAFIPFIDSKRPLMIIPWTCDNCMFCLWYIVWTFFNEGKYQHCITTYFLILIDDFIYEKDGCFKKNPNYQKINKVS